MMENKKVSIIIPCYNAEKYLNEALESIEKQTYDNIEIILIDDGSKDKTFKLLENYKNNSLRKVKIIKQENRGVSSARNNGIINATGEYICFIDSDDIISPFFIEELVRNVKKDTYVTTYYSRNVEKVRTIPEADIRVRELEYKTGIDYIMFRKRNINFWGGIFLREIITNNNINFPEDLIIGEDNVFMWNYLGHMKYFILIDTPLYGYRLVSTSASFKKTERIKDAIIGIQHSIDYTSDKSMYLNKQLKKFMLARTKLSVAKQFVQQKNMVSLCKFKKEEWKFFDLFCIFRSKCGIIIKIVALLLLCSPKTFYYILLKKLKDYRNI